MQLAALAGALSSRGLPPLENEPMSRHTTFRVGGPADLFLAPRDEEAFLFALSAAKEAGVPVFILGLGSNLLVGDKGMRGLVLSTGEAFSSIRFEGGLLRAGSGVSLSDLAGAARAHSLAGFSFAEGIPGSFGGAIYMNAGAYGGEMSRIVEETRYFDGESVKTLPREAHAFGYRDSFFSQNPHTVILCSSLALEPGDGETIGAEMADYHGRRERSQPLELPSAGSVFKRPEGFYTGKLIEECGLKGASVGGAQVSEKHAGFIVNRGGATADDILRLIGLVREKVKARFGVTLECEVRMVGDF